MNTNDTERLIRRHMAAQLAETATDAEAIDMVPALTDAEAIDLIRSRAEELMTIPDVRGTMMEIVRDEDGRAAVDWLIRAAIATLFGAADIAELV